MSVNPLLLPGMTEYPPQHQTSIKPHYSLVKGGVKKTIVVTGSKICSSTLFNNGLIQNVYVLYKMFESMGWNSIMVTDSLPESLNMIPTFMHTIRMLTLEGLVKTGVKVDIMLEVGMSVDPNVKKMYKDRGTYICRLYLGNILNIDIETPFMYHGLFFPHHVQGYLNEAFVSPHYAQHSQYASAVIQGTLKDNTDNVVPYVWNADVLTNRGERRFRWKPPTQGNEIFVIVEPNISFQKTSLVPLCIVESWYRKNPGWKGKVVIVNGHVLQQIPYFKSSLEGSFDLIKDNRVEFRNRMSIIEILTEFPSCIPICYQWNNEYNYMILEYFYSLFPVLHNVGNWSNYGYYYTNSSIREGEGLIEKILHMHKDSLEIYESHVQIVSWRHSPYNPDVQKEWGERFNCV
jgi:hypothetical protein